MAQLEYKPPAFRHTACLWRSLLSLVGKSSVSVGLLSQLFWINSLHCHIYSVLWVGSMILTQPWLKPKSRAELSQLFESALCLVFESDHWVSLLSLIESARFIQFFNLSWFFFFFFLSQLIESAVPWVDSLSQFFESANRVTFLSQFFKSALSWVFETDCWVSLLSQLIESAVLIRSLSQLWVWLSRQLVDSAPWD